MVGAVRNEVNEDRVLEDYCEFTTPSLHRVTVCGNRTSVKCVLRIWNGIRWDK